MQRQLPEFRWGLIETLADIINKLQYPENIRKRPGLSRAGIFLGAGCLFRKPGILANTDRPPGQP